MQTTASAFQCCSLFAVKTMGEFFCSWAVAGFRGQSAVAGGWPSGLAVAPKVASAPRGPGPATLAGCLAQSLPQAPQKKSDCCAFALNPIK